MEGRILPESLRDLRCYGKSRRTHRRCRNLATQGKSFCENCLRENNIPGGVELAKRGEKRTGEYSGRVSGRFKEFYESQIGNLSSLNEVALAKATLAEVLSYYEEAKAKRNELLELVPPGSKMAMDEDGILHPVKELIQGEIMRLEEGLTRAERLINIIQNVVKTIGRAADSMQGKRVSIFFDEMEVEEEVKRQTRVLVEEVLNWLPSCLCRECRTRVADELIHRQRVEIQQPFANR